MENRDEATDSTDATAVKSRRRRRAERNAACYDDEAVAFMKAIDEFRRRYDKSFPSWSEVLDILKGMGYRKVEDPQAFDETCAVEPMDVVEPMNDDREDQD